MYIDCLVKMPHAPGKIVCQKKGDTTYVYYEIDRTYDPEKKYTAPKRVTIGKRSKADMDMIQPNENFLRFFPEESLPEEKDRSSRSSCLRIGSFIVLRQLMKESRIQEILGMYLKPKDVGLFLDLTAYSIITEGNAAQYYPDYAYNHPLFTEKMKIYSDSKISDFLKSLTIEQSTGFLNEWNSTRDHRQKIYISYDSTNKNCQAGDIEIAEFGHAKDDKNLPIFNYSIAYDTTNREPLFYEQYPGSINDVSQFQFMLDKAKSYGYKKVGFILDRGYFSKKNIDFMDQNGYSFVIMVKGIASLIRQLITENKGSFEEEWNNSISEYGVYGKTIKRRLYASDNQERYFHLYYNSSRASSQKREIEESVTEMKTYLMNHKNEKRTFGPAYHKYFVLHYDKDGETFLFPEDKTRVVSDELKLCGYFAIITSEKMSAKEAINLYKSRDASEKLFRGDKSYLGDKSLRVHSSESIASKIFIEFIALIIRCSIYTHLKDALKKMDQKPNYMTVPAALRELEKIEMVRQLDDVYRLDHAVTAKQKTILEAFGINADHVKYRAACISEELKR